jgi:hypothetical protein
MVILALILRNERFSISYNTGRVDFEKVGNIWAILAYERVELGKMPQFRKSQ